MRRGLAPLMPSHRCFKWTEPLVGQKDKNRKRISIDFDWKFKLGDQKSASLENFDATDWRLLDVPHDWSIEGEYDERNPAGIAGAYLPTGIGWYRKSIDVQNLEKDDKYFIEFDGVYMNSDVYINGELLGNRPYATLVLTIT